MLSLQRLQANESGTWSQTGTRQMSFTVDESRPIDLSKSYITFTAEIEVGPNAVPCIR